MLKDWPRNLGGPAGRVPRHNMTGEEITLRPLQNLPKNDTGCSLGAIGGEHAMVAKKKFKGAEGARILMAGKLY
jgi:hypothetical protein